MQNLMQIYCSTRSVTFNGHTVHMLTQWCLLPPLTSTVKSLLFMHVHSSPHSLAASYSNAAQTFLVFIILTMAGHFPDRSCICINMYMNYRTF